MKESVVFPGFETAYNNDNNEFDPQIDFKQFLEEARRFANEKNQHPKAGEESGSKKHVTKNQKKKCRKNSWKNAFFSIWRSASSNNNKANKQHSNSKDTSLMGSSSCNDTQPKQRTHVSSPIYGVGGTWATTSCRQRNRLAASGPLTGLFHHKKWKDKGDENALPYVSLDKLNQPPYDAKTYGPVYLVF